MEQVSLCMNPLFLRIIYYCKLLLNILRFVVPIILIVNIIIYFYKGIISIDDKDIISKLKNKIIACIIIFLVPTIINIFMNLISKALETEIYNGITECHEFASLDYIKLLEEKNLKEEAEKFLSETEKKVLAFNEKTKLKLTLMRMNASNKEALVIGDSANKGDMIKCNSGSNYNTALYNNVRTAGYKTRNGVVAAGLYLSSHIGVHIPYFWTGGHYHSYSGYQDKGDNLMGVPNKWGCQVKMAFKGSGAQKEGNLYPFGLDCSGFVAWAIFNGGYYTGDQKQEIFINTKSIPSSIGGVSVSSVSVSGSKGKIKPGDIAWKKGHVGLVVEVTDSGFTVAEAKSYKKGLIVTNHKYGSSNFTKIILMDNFYNNYKKSSNLWSGFK